MRARALLDEPRERWYLTQVGDNVENVFTF